MFKNRAFQLKMVKDHKKDDNTELPEQTDDYSNAAAAVTGSAVIIIGAYKLFDTLSKVAIIAAKAKI